MPCELYHHVEDLNKLNLDADVFAVELLHYIVVQFVQKFYLVYEPQWFPNEFSCLLVVAIVFVLVLDHLWTSLKDLHWILWKEGGFVDLVK